MLEPQPCSYFLLLFYNKYFYDIYISYSPLLRQDRYFVLYRLYFVKIPCDLWYFSTVASQNRMVCRWQLHQSFRIGWSLLWPCVVFLTDMYWSIFLLNTSGNPLRASEVLSLWSYLLSSNPQSVLGCRFTKGSHISCIEFTYGRLEWLLVKSLRNPSIEDDLEIA